MEYEPITSVQVNFTTICLLVVLCLVVGITYVLLNHFDKKNES